MTQVVRTAMLVGIWLALWSDLSTANLLSGLAVAVAVVVLFDTWRPGTVVVRPWHALRFGLHVAVRLVGASLVVARTVITPRDRIRTGIVAVPLLGCSDALTTLVADAISLTPGTLTIEVRREPPTLFVHALDVRDVDQVRADVRRLEVLAVRAFGSREALAGLAVDDTRSWRGA
ncbi:MAG TPA: Na+/H+ antiporter subunit E [Acidimicrobiales bacterium]|nr:Na+/H+ antiporter subunit E [Acidimicrobiales bacterium]